MNRLLPALAIVACGCHTAWDDNRRENGPSLTLDTATPEADAAFDVEVDLVAQTAPDTDTGDTIVDTAIPETVGIDVAVELRVKEIEGQGTIRFLAWGDLPTDVVAAPFDFAAGSQTVLYTDAFSCAIGQACSYGRRASLDLRDGGPISVVLQLRTTATASTESARYISDQTDYTLTFRAR